MTSEPLSKLIVKMKTIHPEMSAPQIADALDTDPQYVNKVLYKRRRATRRVKAPSMAEQIKQLVETNRNITRRMVSDLVKCHPLYAARILGRERKKREAVD